MNGMRRANEKKHKTVRKAKSFWNKLNKRGKRFFGGMAIIAVLVIVFLVVRIIGLFQGTTRTALEKRESDILSEKYIEERPELDVQLLDVNPFSRPGDSLDKINGIVIHYTANPGTTAQNNRDYFNGLAESKETSASSHFVIGMEGEIIQCIPCDEIAYASNNRNEDTIAIECCIPDDTGKFSQETYDSLLHLTTWLMGRYDLKLEQVIRHYDITGKNCPKYYVEHEDAWEQFKSDLLTYIDKNGVTK